MASKPIPGAADLRSFPRAQGRLSHLADYWALKKPEINFLIMVTTAAGFWMGSAKPFSHSGIILFQLQQDGTDKKHGRSCHPGCQTSPGKRTA
jgi:hypothetical protein